MAVCAPPCRAARGPGYVQGVVTRPQGQGPSSRWPGRLCPRGQHTQGWSSMGGTGGLWVARKAGSPPSWLSPGAGGGGKHGTQHPLARPGTSLFLTGPSPKQLATNLRAQSSSSPPCWGQPRGGGNDVPWGPPRGQPCTVKPPSGPRFASLARGGSGASRSCAPRVPQP